MTFFCNLVSISSLETEMVSRSLSFPNCSFLQDIVKKSNKNLEVVFFFYRFAASFIIN